MQTNNYKIGVYVSLGVAALVLLLMSLTSFTVVPTGHVGVITNFGKVQGHFSDGLHFKNPIAKVYDLDCRTDLFKLENISFPSQDQMANTADIYIKWKIDAAQASNVYAEVGNRESIVEKILSPSSRSLVRQTSKTVKTAEEFYQSEIQEKIQTEMSDALRKDLLPRGIIIEEVLLSDIIPPDLIRKGIEQKKLREQKAQEQEAELVRYRTEQQQQVEKAKADKEASEMDAEKTKIAADAAAYALRTEAEAKAKALEMEGQSIKANPDVMIMRAVESWDGKLPTILGGDPTMLLPIENLMNR
jgi:regulator of protease activity HflC (stomatin/prohibitin superfamily)